MIQPSTRHQAPRSATYRTPFMFLAALVGLIGMQILTKNSPEAIKRAQPGVTRGDVALSDQVLPDEIAGWKKQSFQAAPPAESLPDNQYWWIHAWHYSHGPLMANVSFDQAIWVSWHELTYCYTLIGWELVEREILSPAGPHSDWRAVRARFRRADNQEGWLLFSEFYGDGSPTPPAQVNLADAVRDGLGLTHRLGNRVTWKPPVIIPNTRVLQCQVFVPCLGELGPEVQAQLLQLHLTSRERFREQWLLSRHADEPSATQSDQASDPEHRLPGK